MEKSLSKEDKVALLDGLIVDAKDLRWRASMMEERLSVHHERSKGRRSYRSERSPPWSPRIIRAASFNPSLGEYEFLPLHSLYYATFASLHSNFSFLYLKRTKRFHLFLLLVLCIVIFFTYLKV